MASRSSEHCSVCFMAMVVSRCLGEGGLGAAWDCFLPDVPGVLVTKVPREKMEANLIVFDLKCSLFAP